MDTDREPLSGNWMLRKYARELGVDVTASRTIGDTYVMRLGDEPVRDAVLDASERMLRVNSIAAGRRALEKVRSRMKSFSGGNRQHAASARLGEIVKDRLAGLAQVNYVGVTAITVRYDDHPYNTEGAHYAIYLDNRTRQQGTRTGMSHFTADSVAEAKRKIEAIAHRMNNPRS